MLQNGFQPLHYATKYGYLSIVEYLINECNVSFEEVVDGVSHGECTSTDLEPDI